MAYQVTHPVEIGIFGRFRFGGQPLFDIWTTLETICSEKEWFIGVYCAWDLLQWGKDQGLLKPEEATLIEQALQ